jgi:hypothetical protein
MFNNIIFLNSNKLETNYNELKNNENYFIRIGSVKDLPIPFFGDKIIYHNQKFYCLKRKNNEKPIIQNFYINSSNYYNKNVVYKNYDDNFSINFNIINVNLFEKFPVFITLSKKKYILFYYFDICFYKDNRNNFSLNINMPDINFSGKTTLNIFIKGFLVYRNKLIFSNFKIYNINKYIK